MAFYKVVAVVDDAKGQLAVTAFEMDQSNVMPPQPGAPIPRAPFDPGRFTVDQVTLSELEKCSGLDFGRAQGFRCFGRPAGAKISVERCAGAPAHDGCSRGRALGCLK